MSNLAAFQAVHYASEGSHCEVSSTFGTALNIHGEVDLSSLMRAKTAVNLSQSFPFEGQQHILEPFVGKSVKLKMPLTGLGATAAGAVPSSDLATLLGLLFGNVASGLATGTTFTGGTATAPTTTAASGVAAGALVRGGAFGDGRWGGQFHPASSHSSNTLNLLLASGAAPNNGDVLYASKMIYPTVLTPAGFEAVTTVRLRILTSNAVYDCRGCFPLSAPVFTGLNPGETPMVEIELGVSHADSTTATFPSTTQPQRHAPSPVANGSFVIQQVGTTTRSAQAIRKLEVDFGFTGEGIPGPGGNYEGQLYQSAKRKPGRAYLTVVLDKEAAGTDTWWDRAETDPNSAPYWQALYTATCQDGRAIGLYWPRLALCEGQPTQMNDDGYNRQRIKFEAQSKIDETTDLKASPYRIALA